MHNSATDNLDVVAKGEPSAAQELLPLVYVELRKLAAARMAGERDTATLQPTELVHEAWVRLTGSETEGWQNRAHFFAAAAEAMRRILVDRARRKQAIKRGARPQRLDVEQLDLAIEADEDSLLAIDDALEELSATDRRCADLVKLRFFTGLSYIEAAETLGISERSAKRYWTFARAWLYRELSKSRVR